VKAAPQVRPWLLRQRFSQCGRDKLLAAQPEHVISRAMHRPTSPCAKALLVSM
jgi:hypothetical protein